MAAKVVVRNVNRVESADPGRRGKQDAMVQYTLTIGEGREALTVQGTLTMPWETFTLAQVQAEIKRVEAPRIATVGQSFPV